MKPKNKIRNSFLNAKVKFIEPVDIINKVDVSQNVKDDTFRKSEFKFDIDPESIINNLINANENENENANENDLNNQVNINEVQDNNEINPIIEVKEENSIIENKVKVKMMMKKWLPAPKTQQPGNINRRRSSSMVNLNFNMNNNNQELSGDSNKIIYNLL